MVQVSPVGPGQVPQAPASVFPALHGDPLIGPTLDGAGKGQLTRTK